jgi:hypothetical protein
MGDLRIEAPATDLEALRQSLYDEFGAEADIQEITAIVAGELREPRLIALSINWDPSTQDRVERRVTGWRDGRGRMEPFRVELFDKVLEQPTGQQLARFLEGVEK